jgi:hypothetical protein
MEITHVDRDEWDLAQESEHNVLLVLSVCLLCSKGTQFRYTQHASLHASSVRFVSMGQAQEHEHALPHERGSSCLSTLLVLNVWFHQHKLP